MDSDVSEDDALLDVPEVRTERPEVREVSVSPDHVCAILMDRTVRCWGSGWGNYPKPGTEELRRANEKVTPDGKFKEVEVGDGFACGLHPGGEPDCWPQVAEYRRVDFEAPVDRAKELASSPDFMCFRLSGETPVKCWNGEDRSDTLAIVDEVEEFAVGADHLCGLHDPPIDDGRHRFEMTCYSKYRSPYSPPSQVREGKNFVDIAVGRERVCGLKQDGTVNCHGWDSDERERIGWRYGERKEGPYRLLVAASGIRCGIREENGALECWGEIARGDVPANYDPLDIPSGSFVDVEVAGSGQAVCAIRDDGQLECFGETLPERLK